MSENTEEKRIVWSRDGEFFNDDSLADLLGYSTLEPGDTVEYGTVADVDPTGFIDADDVLEYAGERAYDEHGEVAEGWPDVTEEAKAELQAFLAEWFTKHCATNFWTIKDVQKHVITEQDFIDAGVPWRQQEQPTS